MDDAKDSLDELIRFVLEQGDTSLRAHRQLATLFTEVRKEIDELKAENTRLKNLLGANNDAQS